MDPITIPDDVTLGRGQHEPNDDGEYCFIEAWTYVRGLEWSDRPDCMSPVIGAFLRAWNDGLDDNDRNRLLVPLLARSFPCGPAEAEKRRSFLALDWLVRELTPAFLQLVPALSPHADTLSALPEIVDMVSAAAAGVPVRNAATAAWEAVWVVTGSGIGGGAFSPAGNESWAAARAAAAAAARNAARDATWAAAGDAAWAAAGSAAADASWAAAGDETWAAAADAAYAAAGDAAWAASGDWDPEDAARRDLLTTVETLQLSALRLLDRMEAVGS